MNTTTSDPSSGARTIDPTTMPIAEVEQREGQHGNGGVRG